MKNFHTVQLDNPKLMSYASVKYFEKDLVTQSKNNLSFFFFLVFFLFLKILFNFYTVYVRPRKLLGPLLQFRVVR